MHTLSSPLLSPQPPSCNKAFFTILALIVMAATGHGRPGAWISLAALTAVTLALQCVQTDRAYNLVSAAYSAPPAVKRTLLSRARCFFAGSIIKTASLFLSLLAIGAAIETSGYDEEDEGGAGWGKRRREGGAGAGMTGRVPAGGTTPMTTATLPATTRAHPQPTQPVAVV